MPKAKTKPKPRKMPRPASKLPPRVSAAFRERDFLFLPELAEAFELPERTVRRLAANGILPWHRYGLGEERIHRRFTRADAEIFWRRFARRGCEA